MIVDGSVLMRGRRLFNVDESAILDDAESELAQALRRTGLERLTDEPRDYWGTARRQTEAFPVRK